MSWAVSMQGVSATISRDSALAPPQLRANPSPGPTMDPLRLGQDLDTFPAYVLLLISASYSIGKQK